MDQLNELAEWVECSFHLTFNEHKDFYEGAEEYYTERELAEMSQLLEIDFDKDVWTLQIYDKTPIGFYFLISNTLEDILKQATALMEELANVG